MSDKQGIWKDIPGTNGKYQISVEGKVRSFNKSGKPKELKPFTRDFGSPDRLNKRRFVRIYVNGKRKQFSVLQLMVKTYFGKAPKGTVAYHINGVSSDDCINNIGFKPKSEVAKITGAKARSRPVYKIDENGKILDVYKSAKEAAAKNFIAYTVVTNKCGHKIKNDFRRMSFTFRYCEEIDGDIRFIDGKWKQIRKDA